MATEALNSSLMARSIMAVKLSARPGTQALASPEHSATTNRAVPSPTLIRIKAE